jgi:type IV secretory pathway VirB10-like protein
VRSPRSLVPLIGWLAATLTSIVLASVAMLPVLRTATPDDGALVSADQLRDAGPAEPIPLPSAPSVPAPSATPSPSATTRAPSSAPTAKEQPATPATTPPARRPEATVEDGWTVTTDAAGGRTYLRSFRVEGGQAVIRIRGGRVQLVTATPSEGYEVATVQNSPDNLAVYFNEPNHSFIVHAVWNVDRPFAQVSEVGG